MKSNHISFARIYQEASKKELPLIAGNKAVLLFKHNFKDESFFGEKWL
ncbi:MAG: hypothetical protein KBT04_04025 [Bacteroidales bacterium]|nr:hypothetical protein [Candidatus Colimorpha onthohippi]